MAESQVQRCTFVHPNFETYNCLLSLQKSAIFDPILLIMWVGAKKSEKYDSLEPTNFETEILELTNYLRENQQKFNILKSNAAGSYKLVICF